MERKNGAELESYFFFSRQKKDENKKKLYTMIIAVINKHIEVDADMMCAVYIYMYY